MASSLEAAAGPPGAGGRWNVRPKGEETITSETTHSAGPDLGGAFTPLYQRLRELKVASRIIDVGRIGPRGRSADFMVDDRAAFLRDLQASGRFCTDTSRGRILHWRKISLREVASTDALHVSVGDDSWVLVHLDRSSPLAGAEPGQPCRYSLPRILVHNVTTLSGDLLRLLFGRRLDCAPLLLSMRRAAVIAAARGDERAGPGGKSRTLGDSPGDAHMDARRGSPGAGPSHLRLHRPRAHAEVLPREDEPPVQTGPQPPMRTEAAILRLPFSVIDEAVHVLDNPVEPWSIHLEVRVSGSLDEVRFRRALSQALSAHPLARARKAPSRPSARNFEWHIPQEPDLDPLRVVDCQGDDKMLACARAELESLSVPLAESPPLRVCLAHHIDGDVVILNINHAASDVFGALRLLRSIARAYAGEPDPQPALDLRRIRDVRSLLHARDASTRLGRLLVLAKKTRDLVSVPARMAKDQGTDDPGYGVHLVALSAEQTRALVSGGASGSVNDVLIAALHAAIALWNVEHGAACGRVGVLMPVNLRPAEWHDEVVGNFSLMVRILTEPEERSLDRVVQAVAAQTRRMREEDTFAALIELLGATASWPAWVKRGAPALLAITGNRLIDTAELADLGTLQELPSFGEGAGETLDLWYSPPARMPLGLSLGTVIAVDRLHLAFRYRHPLFSEEAAARFADYYLSLLDHLIAARNHE